MLAQNFNKVKTQIEKHYESWNAKDLKELFHFIQSELKEWDLAELFVEVREAQNLFKEGEVGFDENVISDLERKRK